jgi:hypothetical protein
MWLKRGHTQVELLLPPVRLKAGEIYTETFNWRPDSGSGVFLELVQTFLGVDRGDAAEADISIYDHRNQVVYRRSLHKEDSGIYDAWDLDGTMATSPTTEVRVQIAAYGTSRSAEIGFQAGVLLQFLPTFQTN